MTEVPGLQFATPLCYCGHQYQKMAFDVTPAWEYLKRNGRVYTIRPSFHKKVSLVPPRPIKVHIHRGHKFMGYATKTKMEEGQGRNILETVMMKYFSESGFSTPEEWLEYLINMHGESLTTDIWVIFLVEFDGEKV